MYRQKLMEATSNPSMKKLLDLISWCKKHKMEDRLQDIYATVLKLYPNNAMVRRQLGYVRIAGSWLKPNEAKKLGYYKYKNRWYHAKQLKKRGLVFYEGKWIKKEEAQKTKIAKKKEKKDTRVNKQEKKVKETKDINRYFIIKQRMRVFTPPGNWTKAPSAITAPAT